MRGPRTSSASSDLCFADRTQSRTSPVCLARELSNRFAGAMLTALREHDLTPFQPNCKLCSFTCLRNAVSMAPNSDCAKSSPVIARLIAAGNGAESPPGGVGDAGVEEAHAAVCHGCVDAAVRRGGDLVVAVAAGVAEEVLGNGDELRARSRQPEGAVDAAAAGEDAG